MDLPSGDYEIPLVCRTARWMTRASLSMRRRCDDGQQLPPGVWGPEFLASFRW